MFILYISKHIGMANTKKIIMKCWKVVSVICFSYCWE